MDVNQFIQTTFGAIVGGSVVMCTNWINMRVEKRKSIQSWFEQTYVTEGIDRVLAYFANLELRVLQSSHSVDNAMMLANEPLPTEALSRIDILFGVPIFTTLIARLHECLALADNEDGYVDIATDSLSETHEALFQLRDTLLKLIPDKVSRKNQQLDVSPLAGRIFEILEELRTNMDVVIPKDTDRKEQDLKSLEMSDNV